MIETASNEKPSESVPTAIAFHMTPAEFKAQWASIEPLLLWFEQWTVCPTFDDIRERIANETMQCWGARDAVGRLAIALGSVNGSGEGRRATAWLVAPETDHLAVAALMTAFCKWAGDQGANEFEIKSSPGGERGAVRMWAQGKEWAEC
jgi:hypothetical protein